MPGSRPADPMRSSFRTARLAIPLGFLVYALVLGGLEPGGDAETAFLAFLATVVLAAGLAVEQRATGVVGALLAALLLLPPAGAARPAAITAILVGVLALDCARRGMEQAAADVRYTVPLLLAAQTLLRSRLLAVWPGWAPALLELVAYPLVAGLAVAWLAHREGGTRAGVAAATLVVAGGGLTLEATVSLVLLAAAVHLRSPARTVAAAVGGAMLVGVLLLDPRLTVLLLACALVLHRGERTRLAAAALAVAALAILPAARPWPAASGALAIGLVLTPAVVLASRKRLSLAAAAAAFLLVAHRCLLQEAATAPGLTLLALALPAAPAAARMQRHWSALLLVLALAAGTYPWLRQEPLASALHWVALGPGWIAAALAVTLCVGLYHLERLDRRLQARRLGTAVLLIALLALQLPAPERLTGDVVPLTAASDRWSAGLEHRRVGRVTVDTYLDHGDALETGTPVATLTAVHADGRVERRVLAAGFDTADWAAPATDQRTRQGAAPAFLTWIAAPGLVAQRYRTVWGLDGSPVLSEIRIERDARLPERVSLAVFEVGVQP